MSATRPILSERLERVLALALDEADSLGHGFVTGQHLLYALSLESKGMASEVLTSLGIAPTTIHMLLADSDASHDRTPLTSIDLSKEAHDLFERAFAVAQEWGHSVLDTEHLLFGIASATTSADELLKSNHVSRSDIVNKLEKLRASAPSIEVRDEATHAYRLTLESAWLLSQAADFARQLASAHVSSIHLLLAMLNIDGPVKRLLVDQFKVDPLEVMAQLSKSRTKTSIGRVPLAEDMQIILGLAIGEAWNRGHQAVTPLHMAFAIGRGQSNSAREALADHGVSVSDLQDALELLMPPPVI
jgi:ATP-dependent Clp protease ATP-binding subunit ClpA